MGFCGLGEFGDCCKDSLFYKTIDPKVKSFLEELRKKVVIGFVGGSDLSKQQEQLGHNGKDGGKSGRGVFYACTVGSEPPPLAITTQGASTYLASVL